MADDNPTRTLPVVGWGLMAACVGLFLWQSTMPDRAYVLAVHGLGFIPAVLFGQAALPAEAVMVPAWTTLVTSMFLHGGWMHLLGNMLYLWVFANNVEDAMGHGRFLAFYLICGVAAALTHGALAAGSEIPMIGASGAVSGVLGAYLLLFPRSRITVVVPLGIVLYPLRLPAAVVLGAWFLLQLVSSAGVRPDEPGVAFMAHIGGFIVGMLLIPVFKSPGVGLLQARRGRR